MGLDAYTGGLYMCVTSKDNYGTTDYELKITSWDNSGTLMNFKELHDSDFP